LACNHHLTGKGRQRQTGAALVEFAFTFIIFLTVVLAIIEFAMAIFNWSRMVEATRAGARYAITNDPACNIGDYSGIQECDNGKFLSTTCNPGNATTDPDTASLTITSCSDYSTPACKIVEQMQRFSPYVLSGSSSVKVTYTCSNTGDPDVPKNIPLVTVRVDNVPYHFMTPEILGIQATVTMPSFETTRVSEDLYTNP